MVCINENNILLKFQTNISKVLQSQENVLDVPAEI